ncbi:hypothetical protein COHA_000732 [Chlorella ohadii]|uniref:Uncharacterized protein n=1 Tax=Chlorella ohadii TaxID=2649997 RepID=A0AAD5DWN5_9CHLO|nr:hypothetical protein COHA_000732 [Chlorella ohadii]
MRRAALLLLVALLPLAAAAARRSVSETAVPAAKPLDGSEPEGWYLNQTDTFERRSIELTLPDGKTFTLVLPRLLRDNKVFARNFNDTCGLYTLVINDGDVGGPPPHIHLAEDEWFFPTGQGQVRLYHPAPGTWRRYIPGELPGINVPAQQMGSTLLKRGGIFLSPHGTPHFFTRSDSDTRVTNFMAVHHLGMNAKAVVAMGGPQSNNTDQEVMEQSALLGVPLDQAGKFVGNANYTSIRGDVARFDPQLERLQRLFDAGEACFPADGKTPVEFIQPPMDWKNPEADRVDTHLRSSAAGEALLN